MNTVKLREICKEESEKWQAWLDLRILFGKKTQDTQRANQYRLECCDRFKSVYPLLSDQELLSVLIRRAGELGRNPFKSEVFPAYQHFICMRFKNWPTALRQAGLKPPKEKKRYPNQ